MRLDGIALAVEYAISILVRVNAFGLTTERGAI